MLDEIDFLQPNTHDDLMLSDSDMFNLGFVVGLGNFGGFQLGTTISTR